MQVTLETVSLIIISMAAIAIVSTVFLSTLSVSIELYKPSPIVKVHDVKYLNGSTWFIFSITNGDRIAGVEVRGPSGACTIYREAYTGRTWEVYGYCPDDVRDRVLIVRVHGMSGTTEISVKV